MNGTAHLEFKKKTYFHKKRQHIKQYKSAEDALFNSCQFKREEHFIKVDRFGINVRAQTGGDGGPILFIHGGPNAGSTWAELASLLPEYKCILLDRPGCGLSEAIDGKNLSRELLTEQILYTIDSVLDYFHIGEITLVGSSFGGYWALIYTLQKPERINHLILEGCPALVEGMAVPAFMKSLTYPFLRWLIPKLPTSKSYAKKIMKDVGHTYSVEHGLISETFFEWYVSLSNHTDTLKNDVALINIVLSAGKLNPPYILSDDEINGLGKPTLWLWGEDDPFGGVEIGERIHSKMKKSVFTGFKNSGHLPWLDKPAEHAARIKEFISK